MTRRHFGQGVVAGRVERIALIPQFDHHTVTSEDVDEITKFTSRRARAMVGERARHDSIVRTGEDPPMTAPFRSQIGDRAAWLVLRSVQLRQTDGTSETRVSRRTIGEHDELSFTFGVLHDEFGAEHRRQADIACRFGESHDAVQPIAIGESQSGEIESIGFGHQFIGVGCPVQEREVGVTVQLGVRHTGTNPRHRRRPRGTGYDRSRSLMGSSGQTGLEFGPRGRTLHTPGLARSYHDETLSNICSITQGAVSPLTDGKNLLVAKTCETGDDSATRTPKRGRGRRRP